MNQLQTYLELALVVITAVYVALTWRIMNQSVKQAKAANEQAAVANKTFQILSLQFQRQQVQQFLPIRLAIDSTVKRISEREATRSTNDPHYLRVVIVNQELEMAVADARRLNSAVAVNLDEAIKALRVSDEVARVIMIATGWEGRHSAEITRANDAISSAKNRLSTARSYVEPLLKPFEASVFPTDTAVDALMKKLL
ncbi:MAG TPA: hypothetical protein VNM92_15770 [Thermoanaerobaculia bacterium]|nr:hypothetical protein [Thermoanaerobaculia bacterium]